MNSEQTHDRVQAGLLDAADTLSFTPPGIEQVQRRAKARTRRRQRTVVGMTALVLVAAGLSVSSLMNNSTTVQVADSLDNEVPQILVDDGEVTFDFLYSEDALSGYQTQIAQTEDGVLYALTITPEESENEPGPTWYRSENGVGWEAVNAESSLIDAMTTPGAAIATSGEKLYAVSTSPNGVVLTETDDEWVSIEQAIIADLPTPESDFFNIGYQELTFDQDGSRQIIRLSGTMIPDLGTLPIDTERLPNGVIVSGLITSTGVDIMIEPNETATMTNSDEYFVDAFQSFTWEDLGITPVSDRHLAGFVRDGSDGAWTQLALPERAERFVATDDGYVAVVPGLANETDDDPYGPEYHQTLYHSSDGEQWEPITGLPTQGYTEVEVINGRMMAGSSDNSHGGPVTLAFSDDGGATWTESNPDSVFSQSLTLGGLGPLGLVLTTMDEETGVQHLWFTRDGETWSSTTLEEQIPERFWLENVYVGNDRILLTVQTDLDEYEASSDAEANYDTLVIIPRQ